MQDGKWQLYLASYIGLGGRAMGDSGLRRGQLAKSEAQRPAKGASFLLTFLLAPTCCQASCVAAGRSAVHGSPPESGLAPVHSPHCHTLHSSPSTRRCGDRAVLKTPQP